MRAPQHKVLSSAASRPGNPTGPWLALGAGALAVAGGALWWGLEQSQRAAEKADPNNPALVQLLDETHALEKDFARLRDSVAPTEEDLAPLQRAIENQQEWIRTTGNDSAEQKQRLEGLETLYDTLWLRGTLARVKAAEAAGRVALAEGRRDEGVAQLRTALGQQRLLNQRPGAGRDLPRETELAQEIERLEAEPLAAEMDATIAQAGKLRDAQKREEALAAYRNARELQYRLNREFERTQFASLANLETVDREIATLESAPLFAEVLQASAQAAELKAKGQPKEAANLYLRALQVQQELNVRYARSRHASIERMDVLDVALQTELSVEGADRVEQLNRELTNKLRARDLAKVPELLLEGARIQDALFNRVPRSRRLDPEMRLKFNYLYLHRENLEPTLKSLADQFVPIPDREGRMLRTEVPQRLFEQLMRGNPSRQVGPELPVESVSVPDAVEFCRRLSWIMGRPVRLPKEDEYRAALGGVPAGREIAAQVWSQERSVQRTRPVGTGEANPMGFHDLLGNVAEWLAPAVAGEQVVPMAGGSYADSEAELLKVPLVKRDWLERSRTTGFRVVIE